MIPLFQRFEFSYPNGEWFWDRSGALAASLRERLPRLRVKNSGADQRDMIDDTTRRELFFGITRSSISSTAAADSDFIPLATGFLSDVAAHFELSELRDFYFRYAVGRQCSDRAEAEQLFWPLIAKETADRVQSVAPGGQFQAFQIEFRQGPMDVMARFAVMDLISQESNALAPHLTAIVDARGTAPIALSSFDAEAFMRNVSTKHTEEILNRLAPHLK
jgi:hypothetical protein